MPTDTIDQGMQAAIDEMKRGLAEGGIPIGSSLVLNGEVVAAGHNKRVQDGDPITHAEIDCLRNAGRLGAAKFHRATLYSTLMPCYLCSGAAVQFGIKKVIVAESRNFPARRSSCVRTGSKLLTWICRSASRSWRSSFRIGPNCGTKILESRAKLRGSPRLNSISDTFFACFPGKLPTASASTAFERKAVLGAIGGLSVGVAFNDSLKPDGQEQSRQMLFSGTGKQKQSAKSVQFSSVHTRTVTV